MKDKTDWNRVNAMTEAAITKAAAGDPDTFIPGDDWFATARVVMPQAKDVVTLRLDRDVLEWFRHGGQGGRGYQTRINAVLKAFVAGQQRRP